MQDFFAKPGAASFGTFKPRLLQERHLCGVHSYANVRSSLRMSGASAFGQAPREAPFKDPTPAHYAEPTSTLKSSGVGGFARSLRAASQAKVATPVHAYLGQASTFTPSQGVTFAKSGREVGAAPVLNRVHSYGDLGSTLRTSGVSAWGGPKQPISVNPMKSSAVKMIAALRSSASSQAKKRSLSPSQVEDLLAQEAELDVDAIEAS